MSTSAPALATLSDTTSHGTTLRDTRTEEVKASVGPRVAAHLPFASSVHLLLAGRLRAPASGRPLGRIVEGFEATLEGGPIAIRAWPVSPRPRRQLHARCREPGSALRLRLARAEARPRRLARRQGRTLFGTDETAGDRSNWSVSSRSLCGNRAPPRRGEPGARSFCWRGDRRACLGPWSVLLPLGTTAWFKASRRGLPGGRPRLGVRARRRSRWRPPTGLSGRGGWGTSRSWR